MWARAISLTQAAQTAIPYAEAAGVRTRDFFVVTRAVGEKVPLLRDAVGGFCLLLDVAQPGVVVHTQQAGRGTRYLSS